VAWLFIGPDNEAAQGRIFPALAWVEVGVPLLLAAVGLGFGLLLRRARERE
jgi:hypothetical protein